MFDRLTERLGEVFGQLTRRVKWEGHYTGKVGHLEIVSDKPYANRTSSQRGFTIDEIRFKPGINTVFNNLPNQLGKVQFERLEVNISSFQWLASSPEDRKSEIFLLYSPLKKQAVRGDFFVNNGVFEDNDNVSIYSLQMGVAYFDLSPVNGI